MTPSDLKEFTEWYEKLLVDFKLLPVHRSAITEVSLPFNDSVNHFRLSFGPSVEVVCSKYLPESEGEVRIRMPKSKKKRLVKKALGDPRRKYWHQPPSRVFVLSNLSLYKDLLK